MTQVPEPCAARVPQRNTLILNDVPVCREPRGTRFWNTLILKRVPVCRVWPLIRGAGRAAHARLRPLKGYWP